MKGSESNTKEGRVRVTYIDEGDIIEALQEMAEQERLTASDLIRRATWAYVKARKNPAPERKGGTSGSKRKKD